MIAVTAKSSQSDKTCRSLPLDVKCGWNISPCGKRCSLLLLLFYRPDFTWYDLCCTVGLFSFFFFSRLLTFIIYQSTGHQNCCGTHDLCIFIMSGHGSLVQATGLYYSCEKPLTNGVSSHSASSMLESLWSRYRPDKQNLSQTQEFNHLKKKNQNFDG